MIAKRREVEHEDVQEAWDDITGERLDPREVLKARKIEMQYIRSKKVWDKIRRDEAIKKGAKIIKTRWLDINKGDAWNPNHRSRFVGKEFNDGKGGEVGWFAATPPLEAVKLLISDAATRRRGRGKRSMMLGSLLDSCLMRSVTLLA